MAKTDSSMSLSVNGHNIRGVKRRGKWRFTCGSFPELEVVHRDATGLDDPISHFMALALRGAIKVKELTEDR